METKTIVVPINDWLIIDSSYTEQVRRAKYAEWETVIGEHLRKTASDGWFPIEPTTFEYLRANQRVTYRTIRRTIRPVWLGGRRGGYLFLFAWIFLRRPV